MALIITPGEANAQSYADVTFADTYFATTARAANWTAVGNSDVKEAWMLEAMMVIEEFQYLGGRSNPLDDTLQACEFPRKVSFILGRMLPGNGRSWTDLRGRAWTDEEVPTPIKEGQCETALALAENPEFLTEDFQVSKITSGTMTLDLRTAPKPLTYALLKLRPFFARHPGSGQSVVG